MGFFLVLVARNGTWCFSLLGGKKRKGVKKTDPVRGLQSRLCVCLTRALAFGVSLLACASFSANPVACVNSAFCSELYLDGSGQRASQASCPKCVSAVSFNSAATRCTLQIKMCLAQYFIMSLFFCFVLSELVTVYTTPDEVRQSRRERS